MLKRRSRAGVRRPYKSTKMILGFLLPGAMNLPRSVPFHNDLDKLLGEWSSVGEPLLWLVSVSSGIIFCELVRSSSSPRLLRTSADRVDIVYSIRLSRVS